MDNRPLTLSRRLEYNDFLDAVIGVHGPFKNGPEAYMEAVAKRLREMDIDPSKL